jgi:ribosomal protein S18 acetylase RimI-like enzyme
LEIVRLTPSVPAARFSDVARIHAAEIHLGILPLLGPRFLSRLYRQMAGTDRTGVWAAMESDEVLGFICGCADVKAMYRSVCLRAAVPLGLSTAWGIVRHPRLLMTIGSALTYPFRSQAAETSAGAEPGSHGQQAGAPAAGPRAELLSIAIRADAHRRGIGRMLVRAFEENLAAWDVHDGYWVTTNIDEVESNGFYRAVGFAARHTVRHHNLTLQEYYKEVGPATALREPSPQSGARPADKT